MTAHRDNLAAILAEHLMSYREMPHSELAARLDSSRHQIHLNVTNGTTPEGTDYTIETNIVWDDLSRQHIRVMSDLSTRTGGRLFGFLPIFTSDVADGFVLAPDGTFIDE